QLYGYEAGDPQPLSAQHWVGREPRDARSVVFAREAGWDASVAARLDPADGRARPGLDPSVRASPSPGRPTLFAQRHHPTGNRGRVAKEYRERFHRHSFGRTGRHAGGLREPALK